MGDMGLEYGNEKRVCTPFDVILAFLVSVLIVSKFVGEYGYKLATLAIGLLSGTVIPLMIFSSCCATSVCLFGYR